MLYNIRAILQLPIKTDPFDADRLGDRQLDICIDMVDS